MSPDTPTADEIIAALFAMARLAIVAATFMASAAIIMASP